MSVRRRSFLPGGLPELQDGESSSEEENEQLETSSIRTQRAGAAANYVCPTCCYCSHKADGPAAPAAADMLARRCSTMTIDSFHTACEEDAYPLRWSLEGLREELGLPPEDAAEELGAPSPLWAAASSTSGTRSDADSLFDSTSTPTSMSSAGTSKYKDNSRVYKLDRRRSRFDIPGSAGSLAPSQQQRLSVSSQVSTPTTASSAFGSTRQPSVRMKPLILSKRASLVPTQSRDSWRSYESKSNNSCGMGEPLSRKSSASPPLHDLPPPEEEESSVEEQGSVSSRASLQPSVQDKRSSKRSDASQYAMRKSESSIPLTPSPKPEPVSIEPPQAPNSSDDDVPPPPPQPPVKLPPWGLPDRPMSPPSSAKKTRFVFPSEEHSQQQQQLQQHPDADDFSEELEPPTPKTKQSARKRFISLFKKKKSTS